ncbi:transcription initiation factor TFIID subunit 4-like isoform X2 [Seriola lalandi dorsalis]|uniref:transcription initiation factor TFIID subunit 4-like isoform X2 n=1 Tax=Seriola lalandi dorsalis TaxID=1841481 RepID=UPI000C6F8046|nr:transcription initiation factor TFIID subunit 4-like isoform X2 [Seriola lalandi dorsalis]
MAGASDPLEDMLFNEVDEKAVSDLVGSLESQLGDRKTPAASYSDGKREAAPAAVGQFSGKVRDQVGSVEPQQGHPKAGLTQEPGANEPLSVQTLSSSTSSIAAGAVITAGAGLQTVGAAPPTASPGPGPVTLTTQPAAASFHRAAVLGPSAAPSSSIVPAAEAIRTGSPGLQSLNGNGGAVKLVNSPAVPPPAGASTVISTVSAGGSAIIASMASQPSFPVPQSSVASPAVALQRHPSPVASVAQNGVDPKGGQLVTQGAPSPSASTSQVMNHSNPLMHTKMLVPSQPVSGNTVILTSTPPPAAAQSPISQTQTGTSTAAVTLAAAGVKPAMNGVGQPAVAVVRPPGAPVVATSIQQQRPGLVASSTRAAAPQLPLAVRPQQQTTIQLPPGFTMPPGMVLVRTETGQLVMVPQQVLAQAQAKTQQAQTVASITQRPATPTAGATIRVSTATTAPGTPQTVRLASPAPTRMVQSPSTTTVQAITVAPGTTAVSVKMTTPQKAPTVITAGGTTVAKSAGVTSAPLTSTTPAAPAVTPPARVTVVSQEMQENVKKCKNFLATLIKLASHNSPSPDTSKNVKALVQDLLDAKIEPEEFTTRLQAELKSSPQPYLIPFLKKSLPALRQSLLNSQQSLMTATPSTSAPPPAAPGSVTTTAIRPRLPISPATGTVRLNTPLTTTTALAVGRPGVQTVQTRTPVVISQNLRPQGALVRGPTTIIGKSLVNLSAQANQKKLSDPGGGTFRDDDDINDVASMAGVNLNEENARILATSSELVGTKIRSCKDESFLPTGLLHRRILDTAKKLGVTEVPLEVVNFISHATQSRLRSLLEKVSAVAQHRADGGKDEEHHEPTSDVRSQLRFFEQLERMEKQRKDEQEREMLLKAAKSRARQEDPEQARLKQKAKEMQQQELAQMRQRDANLTALAAIGPRKKRKLDSPGGAAAGTEVASGSGAGSSAAGSSRQQLRQRITRVNLRDFIFCLEQDRTTARSLMLYKALLK